MAWRAIHGAAYRFDHAETTTGRDADVFTLFLLRLAFVLPCVHCRDSYVRFLTHVGAEGMVTHFQNRTAAKLTVKLHNLVNRKLGKPTFDGAVAALRDQVWSSGGFDARDFVGLLLVLALNFVNNSEKDKQRRHREFFEILPELALAIDEPALAGALEHVRHELDRIKRRLAPETYMDALVQALRGALRLAFADVDEEPPSVAELVKRYGLCRV